jgi:hypothetical protein
MKRWFPGACLLLFTALTPTAAHSFCGFYVSSGDAKLFNHASQVVLARDRDRTVLTMANDFKGEPKEFAIVVPVPTVLEKGQIHVGDKAQIDRIDAYSAPRLVEYFDPPPCAAAQNSWGQVKSTYRGQAPAAKMLDKDERARALGVTIEAKYTVGEYDILILSAKQSNGLETWLVENGYRVPPGASRVLAGYLKQGLKFFVAKVNLKEQQKLGFGTLRPIQVAFESPKFGLPIRLGMVNADGPQELIVYAITRKGRVETVNYRSVKLPSDLDVPEYVQGVFPDFYRAMFSQQVRENGMTTVFTEYAWDMGWCDPCASPPLSRDELQGLGVFWLDDGSGPNGPINAFVTRLHVRYDEAHFPEDLVFQETADRTNFQGRYILRHPWKGTEVCAATSEYWSSVRARRSQEAENLAKLTGWDIRDIRDRMMAAGDWSMPSDNPRWWQKIWKN